jgi:hypothetical protein
VAQVTFRRVVHIVPALPNPAADEETEAVARRVRGARALLARDPDCFLRECVASGEGGLLAGLRGYPLPVDELMRVAESYELSVQDWETILERCRALERAARLVADADAERRDAEILEVLVIGGEPVIAEESDENPLAIVAAGLNPAERFLLALKAASPRGFAAGNRDLQRQLEYLSDRAWRRAAKDSARMPE